VPVLPHSSRAETVKETCSPFQQVKQDAACVVSAPENIERLVDTTNEVVISVKDFLNKWKIVSERLDCVVRAVDTITEVPSFLFFVDSLTETITLRQIHPYAKLARSVISFMPKVKCIFQYP